LIDVMMFALGVVVAAAPVALSMSRPLIVPASWPVAS